MGKKRFKNWKPPVMLHGIPTQYNWIVYHPENFKLGKHVDIGSHCDIFAHYGVTIEDYVQIGAGCRIYSINTEDETQGPVIIKYGACIGANSVIFPNVTIGENAKVGALSLVKTDIPANEMAMGIPAQMKERANGDIEKYECLDCRGVRLDREGDSPGAIKFASKCFCG